MMLVEDTPVYYRQAPADLAAETATICIGVGLPPGIIGPRLSIAKSGTAFSSCVDYVNANAEKITRWAQRYDVGADPTDPFASTAVVVEDASPDTCLSLVMIASLVARRSIEPTWIAAAREWESGRMPQELLRSWGGHHNALVHSILDLSAPSESVIRALRVGVAYVDALLRAGIDPNDLGSSLADREASALHRDASAHLAQERLEYRNLAEHALRLQLAIPFAGSLRLRLVDAMIFAEEDLHGSVKAFARSDPSSWTGAGYTFLAVYRPGAPAGNEMTFTVAPEAGLSLLPLWLGLERLEDGAWSGARPRENPRTDLAGYSQANGQVVPSNDPWWDGGPAHDLVGSPGKFGVSTRLGWDAVLEEIWRCFAPGRELLARRRGATCAGVQILSDTDVTPLCEELSPGTALRILDLERVNRPGDRPLLWCPTLERSFAALIEGGRATLATLPHVDGFDLIRVGAGAVVVGPLGILLLSSEHDQLFPAASLRRTASDIAATLGAAQMLEQNLADARSAVREAIPGGRARDRLHALTRLYAIQLRARKNWPQAAPSGGGHLTSLAEACERRWLASKRFHNVLEEAKELEGMLTSSTENRTGSMIHNLAIYGFPAALFGNVLGAAFGPMVEPNGSPWAVGVNAVWWFLGLTTVAILAMFIIAQFNRRKWQRALEDSGEDDNDFRTRITPDY